MGAASSASRLSAMVQASFLHSDGGRYRLLAWAAMPNHLHVLFQPLAPWIVDATVASWKSFTGRRIAEHMDRHAQKLQAGA
jgi:putative transposase